MSGAVGAVSGIGFGVATFGASLLPLASSYAVAGGTDLKEYRGRRVQVVGVLLSPSTANAGSALEAAPQMQLESVHVIGKCATHRP